MNILHSLCVRCGFWWFLPWDGGEMYKILNIYVSLLSFCHKATPARRVSPSWYVYMANCYPGWVIKAGDKRRRTKEALRHLSDTYYAKVEKHLTFINQNIVKSTSNDLLAKQELSVTAKISPSPLLKLRVFTFYLQSTNLTTKVDLTFLPAVAHRTYFQLFRQNYGTYRQHFTILH